MPHPQTRRHALPLGQPSASSTVAQPTRSSHSMKGALPITSLVAKRIVSDRNAWEKQAVKAWNHTHPNQPLPDPAPRTEADVLPRSDPTEDPANATVLAQAASFPPCRPGVIAIWDPADDSITITPVRCKKWTCPRCGPILARIWAKRIGDAKPQRMLTLTCDHKRFPHPQAAYEAMKRALPRLFRLIRSDIGPMEYALVWEIHEDGYPHLHMAHRGRYIPQKWLSRTWDNLGLGPIVDIRQVKTAKGAAAYMAKYMCKTVAAGKDGIRLSRVIQASRRFFERSVFSVRSYVPPGGKTQRCTGQAYTVIRYLVGRGLYVPDSSQHGPPWRFVRKLTSDHYAPPEALLAALSTC